MISWLAGEDWRLEVFRTHGKICEASASSMFNVPIEKIKKEAVELVNDDSDDKDSADELFAAFCGDYVVDNIKQTNGLRRVVRKGDAAFTEYADGSGLYVVARDGVVYAVNGKIRLGTSDDMKIPAGVDSCIDQYIKETSGV